MHRSTRGWSYGNSVTDPRTGEIIKGHVTLGSLRVRQDYLIAEGLLSPYINGDETPPELEEMALARIRQLSAHEVGHTIGLGHNYYASEQGRISVMDYPHPLVTLSPDAQIDLSDAYDVGIGAWDEVAVTYGYQDFPAGTAEAPALDQILDDAWEVDLRYMTNQDTSVNPRVHQWANGTDPAVELTRMMQVRRASLNRFGETAIRTGAPLATIEEAFVPLYLHHRYQVEAAAAALGSVDYVYAMRGDGRQPVAPVAADRQRAALAALIATLAPGELASDADLIASIPPRPAGFGRHRELFPRHTGQVFDALSPARVASARTLGFIFTPARATRLIEQYAVDGGLPGLDEVIETVIEAVFAEPPAAASEYEREVGRTVQRALVERLMWLADRAPAAQVRALATLYLEDLDRTMGVSGPAIAERAHRALLARDIQRHLARPGPAASAATPVEAPPGSPIGDPALDWFRSSENLMCVGGTADRLVNALGSCRRRGASWRVLRR